MPIIRVPIVCALPALLLALLLVSPGYAASPPARTVSVLFVGNSFTYADLSPVRHFQPESVTDLNREGTGGVPALLKAFAVQVHLNYDEIDLWATDHYHGSTYGYYLEALVIFGDLTGRDPRNLGSGERAAAALGIAPPLATKLQQVAAETLAAEALIH